MMSRIFNTRYQAQKARATEPEFNGSEKIIKVWGGFVLMDASDYEVWRKQRQGGVIISSLEDDAPDG